MNELNTFPYKNISHILFSKGAHGLLLVWEIDRGPKSFSGSQGVPTLASPCKPYRQRRPNPLIGCVSLARLQILCLCQNLTAWSSRGLLPVTHLLDLTVLTRCHPPVYKSQRDSLSKHMGSLGTKQKSMSHWTSKNQINEYDLKFKKDNKRLISCRNYVRCRLPKRSRASRK